MGHSSGEIAAAFASGLITANDAMVIAYYRGQAVSRLDVVSNPGAMAAVGLSPEDTAPYLVPGVVVGCENSPSSTTITGDAVAVESVMEAIKKDNPDALARMLRVDRAYHSRELPLPSSILTSFPHFHRLHWTHQTTMEISLTLLDGTVSSDHMESISSAYHEHLKHLKGRISAKIETVPFFSSVTGEIIMDSEQVGPAYWVRNLVSPVRFSTAIANVVETLGERKLFLEVGPHSALAGPLRQNLDSLVSRDDEYVSTLTRGNDSQADILKSAGSLWLQGVPIAFESITGWGRTLVDLPLYPWHYEEPLWRESRLSSGYRLRQFPHHDLLGSRVIESTDEFPSWRNILRPDLVDWLLQYETSHGTIFPAMGFICMAGEAVRQITTTDSAGFTVRNVKIKADLGLKPGQEIELNTQLRNMSTSESMGSSWYAFTVSSMDSSGKWIKHATGQVSTADAFASTNTAPDMMELPRLLSREDWYGILRSTAMRYGPRFAGLEDMSAHVMERRAVGRTISSASDGESTYLIHPTALDCMSQILQVAGLNALTRRFESARLPRYIGKMTIRPVAPQAQLHIAAKCHNSPRSGEVSGTVVAVCDGKIVTEVEDLHLSATDDHAGAHRGDGKQQRRPDDGVLVWKEDINLLDMSSLIHAVEDRTELHRDLDRFAVACIVEAAEQTRNTKPARPHLMHYASWLQAVYNDIRQGAYGDISQAGAPTFFTQRQEIFQELRPLLQQTAAAPAAEAIWRVTRCCREILTGEVDVLELLLEGHVLHELYNFMSNSDCSSFLDLLAHRKPGLKVLEIGAGTGGTTATVLPALHLGAGGQRTYQTYVYTDVSAGFFHTARDRFKDYAGIEFAVLDISKDPLAQGFEPESFDLIIACNVSSLSPLALMV